MATKTKGEPDFEKLLAELESLLEQLEGGSLSLDDSLEKYARAKQCLDICRRKLENAELKIKQINGEAAEDFNPEARA